MAVCLQPEQMVWISVRTGRTVPEWKGIRLIRKWYHQRQREEKQVVIESEPEDPADETGQEDNHWMNRR